MSADIRRVVNREVSNDSILVGLTTFLIICVGAGLLSLSLAGEYIWLRWVVYLYFILAFALVIGLQTRCDVAKVLCNIPQKLVVSLGCVVSGVAVPYLFTQVKSLGFNGAFHNEYLLAGFSFAIIACLVATPLWFMDKDSKFWTGIRLFLYLVICLILLTSLMEFRSFGAFASNWLFACITGSVVLASLRMLGSTWVRSLILSGVSAVAIYLAWRSDWLQVDLYHPAYFIDVVSTLKSGGKLYESATSQYGLLPIMIASWIPTTALNAFHILQSSLLSIVIGLIVVIIATWRIPIIIGVGLISLVVAADPGLIGPNPYPSSSVMRFFPCYLMITSLILIRNFNKNSRYLLGLLAVVGGLWSAENLIYLLAVVLSYEILNTPKGTSIGRAMTSVAVRVVTTTSCVVGLICVCLYLLTGANWPTHFYYGLGYADRLGAVPLEPTATIFLILSAGIACCAFIEKADTTMRQRMVTYLSVALVVGMASYYFGRAVPHNITAMSPILATVFAIVTVNTSPKQDIVPRVVLYYFIVTGLFNAGRMVVDPPQSSFLLSADQTPTKIVELASSLPSLSPQYVSVVSLERFAFQIEEHFDPALPSPPMLLLNPLPQSISRSIIENRLKSIPQALIVFPEAYDVSFFQQIYDVIRDQEHCIDITNPAEYAGVFHCVSQN